MDLWIMIDRLISIGTLITLVWAVRNVGKDARNEASAPERANEARLKKLEDNDCKQDREIQRINEKLSRDYDRMIEFEKFMKLTLRAQLALINNALGDSQSDELNKVKDAITDSIYKGDDKK